MCEAGCSVYNGYIYCVGTNCDAWWLAYYAPISNTGIGTWTSTTSIASERLYDAGCSIYNGYIYCVGAYANPYFHYVYYAPISGTGIGSWTNTPSYPIDMYYAGCSIYNGYIYCVSSGSYPNTYQVYYAPVSSTGVGTWTSTTRYPIADMEEAGCSISGGYIYCVGTSQTTPYNYVYYAPVSSTGVGTWTASPNTYPISMYAAYCEIPGSGGGYYGGGGNLPFWTPFISASNALVDIGQYETLKISWPGGSAPFTVKFYNESNSLTFNTLGSLLLSDSPATNTFKLVTTGGGITWNGVVVDSSPATKNSIDLHIGVNSAITGTPATPTPTSPTIDNGQSITLTAGTGTVSGGTTPYTYNWFTGTACQTLTAGTGSSVTVSPTSTTGYSVEVMDSASTPANSVCSGVDTVTVTTPSLSVPTIAASNTMVDAGQYETLTISWSGGTSTFKAKFFNESDSGGVTFNTIPGATSPTTNTFIVLTPGAHTGYTWNGIVIDSAYSPLTKTSLDLHIGVNSALTDTPSISPSAPTIDSGQSVTLSESGVSGGTTPYTYNWFTGSGCGTANIISGQVGGSISVSPTTTNSYSVNVIDSASTPANSVCSSVDTVSVNTALSVPSLTGTSSLNNGLIQTLSGTWNYGTPPFTVQFYNESKPGIFNTLGSATSPSTNSFLAYAVGSTQSFTWNFIVTDSSYLSAVTRNSVDFQFSVIPSTCTFTSPSTLSFGDIGHGFSTITTSVQLQITNTGNTNSNILIYGGNWIGQKTATANFMVMNTVWTPTSGVAIANANQLTYSPSYDTFVTVPASGGTGSIYLGLSVPQYQAPQDYNQIITVSSSC
jgi:hypothetical protein